MSRVAVLAVCLLTLATSGVKVAQAAETSLSANEIIAARQAGFDLQSGVAAAMKAGVAAGGDVKPFTDGAKGLLAWAKVIPTLFPPGTETGHETKAKPEVWSDAAGFRKAASNFAVQAEKLLQLAEANDKAGFAAQFQETGKACGACHRPYRVKE